MPFTRMQDGKLSDWIAIGEAVQERQSRVAERMLAMLQSLRSQFDGFAVSQYEHSLQTATRAFRAEASEEVVVAALFHDIGKAISVQNHAATGAELLKPFVSEAVYQVLRTHQDFQGKHYYALMGKNPNLRRRYREEPWYDLACRFSDDWDQVSFDPAYDTQPLEFFEPMIHRVFGSRPG